MLICDFCKCAENTEKLLLRDVCKKCKPIILKYIDNRLKEIKIVWINDLNHPELKLIKDIPVCIEEEEGDVCAYFEEAILGSQGTNEKNAITSLKDLTYSRFLTLIDLPIEKLGAIPKAQLQTLSKYITRV